MSEVQNVFMVVEFLFELFYFHFRERHRDRGQEARGGGVG